MINAVVACIVNKTKKNTIQIKLDRQANLPDCQFDSDLPINQYAQPISEHFDNAPVIEVSGRSWPVDVLYRPIEEADEDSNELIDEIVDLTLDETFLYKEEPIRKKDHFYASLSGDKQNLLMNSEKVCVLLETILQKQIDVLSRLSEPDMLKHDEAIADIEIRWII